MHIQSLKDQVRELAERHPRYDGKEKTDVIHIQELDKYLNQIQETIKIGDRYDIVVDQIVDFVNEVKSIEEQNENRLLLKEGKSLLIDVAKQFQETIINIQNGNLPTAAA